MPSLPLNLRLSGRLATIVGGGKVALRKALTLRAAGARVRIVAPSIETALKQLIADESETALERAYESADLDGSTLVIAATGDAAVNARVIADARERGILCSDAADPTAGDFTLPATLRLDDITIAVDTAGASPGLAKRLAADLGSKIDPNSGRAAATLRTMRDYARGIFQEAERTVVLQQLSQLPLDELAHMNPADAQHRVDALAQSLRGLEPAPVPGAVVCATRGSRLALVQTKTVAAKLAVRGIATTILPISTLGDKVQDRSLAAIGSESLFVKELELALRDGRAAYAVHSCKDLPSVLPDDMLLVAISAREDPRDAFCSDRFEGFALLPAGSRVGTSSMRRRAQLLALRSDLEYVDIRGNVDTRLRKLRDGDYDAVVLAMAGLSRLGIAARHTVPFETGEIVPAVGQGALAVEMTADSAELSQRIRAAINEPESELAVLAERAALAALRGGCQAPIGLYAKFDRGGVLHLQGIVVSADGRQVVRAQQRALASTAEAATMLGLEVAAQLAASGATGILGETPAAGRLRGRRIVLPRTRDRRSLIAEGLETEGARVVQWRKGEAATRVLGEALPDMIVFPSSGSVEAATVLLEAWRKNLQRPAVAAMGPASAAAATASGFPPDVIAPEADVAPLIAAVREYFR